ncbi:hypothetical protein EVG20_g8738 [Dentipellis fragilis]|uniref:Uncharacterized protein n=1 Tax=Dentipellis fragilis TaxID=205917 RepID=A0A4Y9Y476_9AGAM|nr:hypothetical protein EVG20_g8738 [Dentipellis fragilis]
MYASCGSSRWLLSYYKIIPKNILVPLSFLIMSNWSLDSQDASVLYSTADSGLTISSSPAPINKREGVSQSRTTSPAKQKRRQKPRLPKDPALIAAANDRAEKEWRNLQMEWSCYPWQSRPKSRRQELQKLPALCNDFESFDKQMACVDRRPDDKDGLRPQIRAFMYERRRSLQHQEDEAEMQKLLENISRTRQGVKDFRQYGNMQIEQFSQAIDENGQGLQQMTHQVDSLAEGVNPYGPGLAQPMRRIRQTGKEGRNIL